jgi:hypothetical protein
VGDFNGDGKQDLVTANQYSNNVSILLRDCPATPTQHQVQRLVLHRLQQLRPCQSYLYSNTDSDSDGDGHSHNHSYRYGHSNSYRHGDGYIYTNTNVDTSRVPFTHT